MAFADRILLNKVDLVTETDLQRVEARLTGINAFAEIQRCTQSAVSVDSVLNIGGFDLKRTLEMDPEFLNTDNEHEHDDSVTSISIVVPGNVHMLLMNQWVSELLKTKGTEIYRMKGVLSVSGSESKYVFQAVHMIFDGKHSDEAWAEGEERMNTLVFIGKNLDKEEIEGGFAACFDCPENKEAILKIQLENANQHLAQMVLGAAQRDDTAMLKKLLGSRYIDVSNRIGQTPLHMACLWGRYMSVKLIIDAGANLNLQNKFDSTPLHMLAQMGKGPESALIETAKLMVAAGADLTVKDDKDAMAYEYCEGELRHILTPK